MGTRPRPRQAAAAAAGGDVATGGQNGPQADTDALRHPRHSATVLRPSADDTTANQTTTIHRWCDRIQGLGFRGFRVESSATIAQRLGV